MYFHRCNLDQMKYGISEVSHLLGDTDPFENQTDKNPHHRKEHIST